MNKENQKEINEVFELIEKQCVGKEFKELIKEIKELVNENIEKQYKLDKIKEIPLKHIDNANEELQMILRNNNDLEYKNQCSHDFEIIRQNVEMIYNEILDLLEEIE